MRNKIILGILALFIASFTLVGVVHAHDGWVQSNVARVTVDDMVYIDMQFGNHQNMHRDYLIYASKWDIAKATFTIHTPKNDAVNMKDSVIDVGKDEVKSLAGGTVTYTDRNGYLVASFQATQKGIYIVDVRQDVVVSYAPERSIKCAKSIVGALESSMKSNTKLTGFDRSLGQVLEVVPLKDPTMLAVGDSLPIQILFKGSPLPDAMVSVIPRGETLPPMGTPNPYDLMTDMDGMASFTFAEANYHLIVVHVETDESGVLDGKSYSATKYTGDLTVIVAPTRKQSASTDASRTSTTSPIASLSSLRQTTTDSVIGAFNQALTAFKTTVLLNEVFTLAIIAVATSIALHLLRKKA